MSELVSEAMKAKIEGEMAMAEKAGEIGEIVGDVIGQTTVKGYKTIEKGVTQGYKKIEEGVVGGYKKIEDGVVGAYKKVEDAFVDKFLKCDPQSSWGAEYSDHGNGERHRC